MNLKYALRSEDTEQIAVITGMAVVITADNLFESIMEIPA